MTAAAGDDGGRLSIATSDPPDAAAEQQLQQFLRLLAKWNRVYNLTAITDPARMWTHHVLDSLSLVTVLDPLLASSATKRLLDVGSGAGLPGIPLAIVRHDWEWTLLDSNSKKTAFTQQAIADLQLSNATVATARVEAFGGGPFAAVVSRAFASLADFVEKTRHLLAPGGCWVAMKGSVPEDELMALPANVVCTDIVRLHVPGLDAQRHALLLKVKAG
ncbi:MAG: 16S rRNA (guanine(527)-N(7))-methyltransferase RsmG [Betaproteobacteria bacterium]